MRCNIDAKGKAVRLVSGLVMATIGAAVLVALLTGAVEADWARLPAIGAIVFGLFGVVEGLAGWCAVRALGIRTRL